MSFNVFSPKEPLHPVTKAREGMAVFDIGPHPLEAFFRPKGVALIGATDKVGSVGRTVLYNLITSPFGGAVYPVNPKRENVLGIKAYTAVSKIPGKVDLCVITTPAQQVPGIFLDIAQSECKCVIIISAGFAEEQVDEAGKEALNKILTIAKKNNIRIIGPNCLGTGSPVSGMNATFGGAMPLPGKVAFLTQSGALLCAIMDWSLQEKFGFSHVISIGSMADIDFGDCLDFLGQEPTCNAIVMYMESIGNPRKFLSAARRVALSKPIIVIKVGRTEAAAKAAASHTGTMTGSDAVLDAALKRCGVMRVDKIGDLFYLSDLLSTQPLPNGKKLTIITNAGGPGCLATESLSLGGGQLADISEETMSELNKFLPGVWSHNNPVDIIGDATPDLYAKTLEVCVKDPNSDGVLVICTPQAMTDMTRTADALRKYAHSDKPVIASWMGGRDAAAGMAILKQADIPNLPYPDEAVEVFNHMWKYKENLKELYQLPEAHGAGDDVDPANVAEATRMIETARQEGRRFLTEYDSKKLMALYGIPVTPMEFCTDPDAAAKAATDMGFPVVVKLASDTITHKADVGGVQLNIMNEDAVRKAYALIKGNVKPEDFLGVTVQPMLKLSGGYETIVGSNLDPQLGPVLLFGTGGSLVEIYKDSALGLPPLNEPLAMSLIQKTKIFEAFKGVRGLKPVDVKRVTDVLVKFSGLVLDQPFIAEVEINPLFVSSDHVIALDARVVLHPKETTLDMIPKSALRPYPRQFISQATLNDGIKITIRPTKFEDEPAVNAFLVQEAEDEALAIVFDRYFAVKQAQKVLRGRLVALCSGDYEKEIALLAETPDKKIAGVARLTRIFGQEAAEFAIFNGAQFLRKGLGRTFVHAIEKIAKAEGYTRLESRLLTHESAFANLLEKSGFTLKTSGTTYIASKNI